MALLQEQRPTRETLKTLSMNQLKSIKPGIWHGEHWRDLKDGRLKKRTMWLVRPEELEEINRDHGVHARERLRACFSIHPDQVVIDESGFADHEGERTFAVVWHVKA